MGKFSDIKQNIEYVRQANALKKEMEKIKTKIYEGDFEVVINGEQHVEEILENGRRRQDLEKLFNKAIKESQKEVAKKMKNRFSGLKFPGA